MNSIYLRNPARLLSMFEWYPYKHKNILLVPVRHFKSKSKFPAVKLMKRVNITVACSAFKPPFSRKGKMNSAMLYKERQLLYKLFSDLTRLFWMGLPQTCGEAPDPSQVPLLSFTWNHLLILISLLSMGLPEFSPALFLWPSEQHWSSN